MIEGSDLSEKPHRVRNPYPAQSADCEVHPRLSGNLLFRPSGKTMPTRLSRAKRMDCRCSEAAMEIAVRKGAGRESRSGKLSVILDCFNIIVKLLYCAR